MELVFAQHNGTKVFEKMSRKSAMLPIAADKPM